MRFAELFDTELGQVVVLHQLREEGPEVRVFWVPEGLGVCSFALIFPDTEEGEAKAQSTFEGMNEAAALELISKTKFGPEK